jgi:hypothetical protein
VLYNFDPDCAKNVPLFNPLLAALSGLLLHTTAKAHGVRGLGGSLAPRDLGLLERAVGFLLRDAALLGGRPGQRGAVGVVVLHNVGIC